MAEKKITPKAPEKTESSSSKTAAARVSKSKRQHRHMLSKKSAVTRT